MEKTRLTLDAPEVFRLLGISRNTGYSLIKAGTFPLPIIKAGRRILIPKIAVQNLLETTTVPDFTEKR